MAFNIVAKLKVIPDDLSLQQLKNQIQAAAGGASGDATINIKLGPNTIRSLSTLEKKLSSIVTTIDGIPTAVTNAINSLNQLGKVKINVGATVKTVGSGSKSGGNAKQPLQVSTPGLSTVDRYVHIPQYPIDKIEKLEKKYQTYVKKHGESAEKLLEFNKKKQKIEEEWNKSVQSAKRTFVGKKSIFSSKEIDNFIEDFTSGKKMRGSKMNAGSFTIREMFGDEKFEQMVQQRTESINKTLENAENKLTAKAQARRERRKVQDVTKLKGIHERFIAGETLSMGDYEFAQRAASAHLGPAEFSRMFGGAQMVKPSRPGGRIRYANAGTFEAMKSKDVEDALSRLRLGKDTQADRDLLTSTPELNVLANQAMREATEVKMRRLADKYAAGKKVDTAPLHKFADKDQKFRRYFENSQKQRQNFEIDKNQKQIDKKNRSAALAAFRSGKTLDADQNKIIAGLYGDKTTRNIIADALNQRAKSLDAQKAAAQEAERKNKQLANDAKNQADIQNQNARVRKYDKALGVAESILNGSGVSEKNYGLMRRVLKREGMSDADIDRMIGGGASNATSVLGKGTKFYRSDIASGKRDMSVDSLINKIVRGKGTAADIAAIRGNPADEAKLKAASDKHFSQKAREAIDIIGSGRRSQKAEDFLNKYKSMPQILGGPTVADVDAAFAARELMRQQKQQAATQKSRSRKTMNRAGSDAEFMMKVTERIARGESISSESFARASKLDPNFVSGLRFMEPQKPGAGGRYIGNSFYKQRPGGLDRFVQHTGLAAMRFGAFTMATAPMFAGVGAAYSGMSQSLEFEKEMIKISQTLGSSTDSVKDFGNSILHLSTALGQKASELAKSARMFTQAGYTKAEAENLTKLLGKTQLSASFDDLESTREGMIAVLQQFGEKSRPSDPVTTQNISKVLDSINQVSADFAVESGDLVDAIRRAGSIFASSTPKGVGGVETSQQLMALFTAIRDTTRLQPEMISTALVKVGSKLQTAETQKALTSNLGISLKDENNQFIGIYESLKLISTALSKYEGTDSMFPLIAQEIGGAHHIAKVIPLLQNFGKVEAAMSSAKFGEGSLDRNAKQAMESFSKRLEQIAASIDKFVNDVFQSGGVRKFADFLLTTSEYLIKLADAAKGLIVPISALLAIMGFNAIRRTNFGASMMGGLHSAIHGPDWMQLTGFEAVKRERWRKMAGIAALGVANVASENINPDTREGVAVKGMVSGGTMGAMLAASFGGGPLAVGLTALAVAVYSAADAVIGFDAKLKQTQKEELGASIANTLAGRMSDDYKMNVLLSSIQQLVPDNENPYYKNINPFQKNEYNGFSIYGHIDAGERDKFAFETKEQLKNASQGVALAKRRYVRGEIGEAELKRILERLAPILHAGEKSAESFNNYLQKILNDTNLSQKYTQMSAGITEVLNSLDKFSESLEDLHLSIASTTNIREGIAGRASHVIGESNKFSVGLASPKIAAGIKNEQILRDNLAKILIDGAGLDTEDKFVEYVRSKAQELIPNSGLPDLLPKILRDNIGFENVKEDISTGNVSKLVQKIMQPFEHLKNMQEKFNSEYKKVLDEVIKSFQMEQEKRQEIVLREGSLVQKRRELKEIMSGRKSSIDEIDRESIGNLVNIPQNTDQSKYIDMVVDQINRMQGALTKTHQLRDVLPMNHPLYAIYTRNIEGIVARLGNANLALEKLSNTSARLSEIQSREAAMQDAVGSWELKSPSEQAKIENSLRLAGHLLSTGQGLQGLGYKQKQDINAGLMQFKNVPINIPGLDGIVGEEGWARLLRNTNPNLAQLHRQKVDAFGREIKGGEAQQGIAGKQANGLGAAGFQQQAEVDRKIQLELKKASLESAAIFEKAMKVFEAQTKDFSNAVDKLKDAKVEMKGDFNLNVNMNGANVFANMQEGFKQLMGVEIFKALNMLVKTKFRMLGNINPADLGLDMQQIEAGIGKN